MGRGSIAKTGNSGCFKLFLPKHAPSAPMSDHTPRRVQALSLPGLELCLPTHRFYSNVWTHQGWKWAAVNAHWLEMCSPTAELSLHMHQHVYFRTARSHPTLTLHLLLLKCIHSEINTLHAFIWMSNHWTKCSCVWARACVCFFLKYDHWKIHTCLCVQKPALNTHLNIHRKQFIF